jgi:DNA invertase Pin-like site-specific DNA recombinase
MIRAVLYLRSSKDRADVSIDAQRRALQEMAEARGVAIVGEFADAVESGKDDDRPGFQNLIAAIRSPSRAWDHILVLDTARVARRRALGIIFEEHECKKRGVRILYRSLPESDPITEMLLKSILQAMDEWHSLTSRVKGLAGMSENVKQGFRAGGRAPLGYVLESVDTGSVRDGAPVLKSRLAPGPDAPAVKDYLTARAAGIPRSRALASSGLSSPVSSLVSLEQNALTYAGATVWNRHAERVDGGYVGGAKVRPRSEWVIQRDTHPALITWDQAEAILAAAASKSGRRDARKDGRVYLLGSLLFDPTGAPWHGDAGSYRLGKGPRVAAEAVESAVVALTVAELQSEERAKAIAEHYRRLSSPGRNGSKEVAVSRRKVADLDKRIARLVALVSQTSAPDALLRQVEAMEAERAALVASVDASASEASALRSLRSVSAADVRRMLAGLADDLAGTDPAALRDVLGLLVERVVLDPATFEAVVHFRLAPAQKAGVDWRPHGDSNQSPVFSFRSSVAVRHNRRAA